MTPAAGAQSGLSENVAGLLCYLLGWITGLIFYFIDKRPFVRFHAAQSIVVFGGLMVIRIVLSMLFVASGAAGFSVGFGLLSLVSILGVILWILLMIKAYQGEKFRIPLAADLADQIFRKVLKRFALLTPSGQLKFSTVPLGHADRSRHSDGNPSKGIPGIVIAFVRS